MAIKSSYQVAENHANNLRNKSDIYLADVECIYAQETNFLKGRAIYSEMQTIISNYNEIIDRDAQNIENIAWEFCAVDDVMSRN